jgi:hypothetical protein
MWCLPDACIFLSSHSAEGEVKDATWLAKVLGGIEELGPENVVLVVTDNAAVCVKAGKGAGGQVPHIMWVGLAHGLDLLIKDICKPPGCGCQPVQEHREVHQHDKTRQLFLVHSHSSSPPARWSASAPPSHPRVPHQGRPPLVLVKGP